jgi:hypothetical protein
MLLIPKAAMGTMAYAQKAALPETCLQKVLSSE